MTAKMLGSLVCAALFGFFTAMEADAQDKYPSRVIRIVFVIVLLWVSAEMLIKGLR